MSQRVVPDLTGMGANGILSKLDRADAKRASVTPSATLLKNRRGAMVDSPANSIGVFTPIYELSTVADFTCLGLHISGPTIDSQFELTPEPSECGGEALSSMHSPGKILGLLPVTGGTLEVDLPTGSAVDVQLFGIVTSDGACPSVATLNNNLQTLLNATQGDTSAISEIISTDFQFTDQPFELASSQVTLNQDLELVLQPSFDPSELKPEAL